MGLIQEITSQTTSGTEESAKSIGILVELAGDMRNSVSGFTLPGDEVASASLPEASVDVSSVQANDNESDSVIEAGGEQETDKQEGDPEASAA